MPETTDTKPCAVCAKPIPAAAAFCTECERWQVAPRLLKAADFAVSALAIAASIVVPVVIVWATHSYESVHELSTRLDTAAQREAQVFEALSEALSKTIDVSKRFREGVTGLEAACTPALNDGAAEAKGASDQTVDCIPAFLAALVLLDNVVAEVSWSIDTAPVKSDTYARASNLKYEYFRGCANDAKPDECGYRQRLLRFLHTSGSSEQAIALKQCDSAVSDDDRKKCADARESMKAAVVARARERFTELLCSITRDANEFRVLTWKKMQVEATSYKELAARLEGINAHSDCARRLREHPIPSDCPYGYGFDGQCL